MSVPSTEEHRRAMESVLRSLASALELAMGQLDGDFKASLDTALHNTEELPDKILYSAASEVLDLLSKVRLLLEPAHLILADHFLGYTNTKALCTAVELKVADQLESGPKTVAYLAQHCNARKDRLKQVLRTLHNNGIFSLDAAGDRIQNNRVSEILKTNHWTQWHNWVDLYGNEFYDMARSIPESCKVDAIRCPAQINFDTDDSMFKYFTDQGWLNKFHKTLSGGAIAQAPGILSDYPWEEVASSTVIDIGGGGGGLIALLLRQFKSMRGSILETAAVIEQAKSNFHGQDGQYADVGDRVAPEDLIAGNFFQEVPASEVYTMKWVLHDWNDEKAVNILRNIRQSVTKGPYSRLIIFESLLEDGNRGRLARYADMNMMIAVGGKERDEVSWRRLAEGTGWKLRNIYRLRNAWPCAIEFIPDWAGDNITMQQQQQQSSESPVDSDTLTASMKFLEAWNASRGVPFVRMSPAPGYNRMNFEWKDYPVQIRSARRTKGDFSLDNNGFAYFEDEIAQDLVDGLRGNNRDAMQQSYYRHVEAFVKKITGSRRVILFDHTLRKRRPELSKTQNDDGKEQPATMVLKFPAIMLSHALIRSQVHCDQSEWGALRRLQANIGDDENIDDLLKGRVQMIK
ncbi:hypothetical protein DHEL01_v206173 [Diaporthe helianthi]|uniref:Uncharacterized protein n=1 Tax=Diaporthe helianthi TaxID=158607 RepID=A0A2P5HYU8_DIAHE|nr:hypothetical protein DHEL01_v206173 [Diaporthe helianthi]